MEILDPGPIPFARLPAWLQADDTFRYFVDSEGSPPEASAWRLVRIPLVELADSICEPEAFLEAREEDDPEGQYDRVLATIEAFLNDGETARPAIAIVRREGAWRLLDGSHRLSAAAAAQLPGILAFELL